MNRLTTDIPKGNFENALNLFYNKDGWTWVRRGGTAPDYKDVSRDLKSEGQCRGAGDRPLTLALFCLRKE